LKSAPRAALCLLFNGIGRPWQFAVGASGAEIRRDDRHLPSQAAQATLRLFRRQPLFYMKSIIFSHDTFQKFLVSTGPIAELVAEPGRLALGVSPGGGLGAGMSVGETDFALKMSGEFRHPQ